MKGQNIMKHPDRDEITRMLTEGYTADEVSKWLSQKHKHKMYYLSAITLNYYRQNYLKMEREQIAVKRKELLASGNTKELNVLDSFASNQNFIEAKEKAAAEIINIIENFKSIQDKILERINLMDESTKDDNGKMIYKPRNEEIYQGYLARLESMTTAYMKSMEVLNKKNLGPAGTTEISITMNEMTKYAEFYKAVMQKTLVKFDPSLLNDFLADFNIEMGKMLEEQGIEQPKVNISINNNGSSKISVSTHQDTSTVKIEPQNNTPEYIDLDDEDAESINNSNKPEE